MNPATISPAPPQHMRALARANEVRLARAELKRRVGDGEITAASVVMECPEEAVSMELADLLASQRRWGETRCRKFLHGLHLPETKTIGSLTERQRIEVATHLRAAMPGRARARARELSLA